MLKVWEKEEGTKNLGKGDFLEKENVMLFNDEISPIKISGKGILKVIMPMKMGDYVNTQKAIKINKGGFL